MSSDETRSLSHVINRIIDHRGDKNHREYLVEWQEDDEQEWVKAEDFDDHEIISKYWAGEFESYDQTSRGKSDVVTDINNNTGKKGKRAKRLPTSLNDYELF